MARHTIRWVLTHDPIALFEDAARRFAEIVHVESEGELEVQVMTPTEYGDGVRVPAAEVMRQVAEGELEMSQTYTTILGQLSERLWTLDLPFLFDSHVHAARVLDGPLGRTLLDSLTPHRIRGLAFTYSGGYRIISSLDRPIRSLEDIRGLNVRTSFNPVVQDLFRRLGATPHPAPLQAVPDLTADGTIDAAESTWPRFWDMGHARVQAIVNQTSHSLFLTALVVNEAFYQRLPERLQRVLREAALVTARHERAKSIRDGEIARDAFRQQGGLVATLSSVETDRLRAIASGIYDTFAPRFGEDFIAAIREASARAVA